MSTTIIIFEDNAELIKSLTLLFSLSPNFDFLGGFKHGMNAQELVKSLNPDLILMDIDMPNIKGVEVVKNIREVNSDVKILMHTVFDDAENLFTAIQNGANGYILKKAGPDKLLEACEEVMNGGAPITPSVATLILQEFNKNNHTSPDYNLTPKEKEVLTCLVDGLSYKMIADELKMSIDTVRSHIKKIYEKLHVHSMSEAVAKAIKQKIV
jgi:DNA-binding NarL/FixJ family response regulator